MKFLAIESELPGAQEGATQLIFRNEAARVWELYQLGIIRELYFHAEQHTAVLILECSNSAEAEQALSSLPLVQGGYIAFNLLPLVPYTGFARLFEKGDLSNS